MAKCWENSNGTERIPSHGAVNTPLLAILDTWTSPLHYGTWGGAVTQVLYLLSTLVPAILAYTGWVLWRSRVHRGRITRPNTRISPVVDAAAISESVTCGK